MNKRPLKSHIDLACTGSETDGAWDVEVSITDQHSNALSGFIYEIYDVDRNLIETLSVDSDAIVVHGLESGVYTLVERDRPCCCKYARPVSFKLDPQGTIEILRRIARRPIDSGIVSECYYQVFFHTKFCKDLIDEEMQHAISDELLSDAHIDGVSILHIEMGMNHMEITLKASHVHDIKSIVRSIKRSAAAIYNDNRNLTEAPQLWSNTFYAKTIGLPMTDVEKCAYTDKLKHGSFAPFELLG